MIIPSFLSGLFFLLAIQSRYSYVTLFRRRFLTAIPNCEASQNPRVRFPRHISRCAVFDLVTTDLAQGRLFSSAKVAYMSLQPFTRFIGNPVFDGPFNCSSPNSTNMCELSFQVNNLLMNADYLLTISEIRERRRSTLCQVMFSTLPSSENLVLNSGFEQAGDSPFMPTRFFRSEQSVPRMWTPFYNGGLRISCGTIHLANGRFLHPRSGRCCAELGYTGTQLENEKKIQKFFGAHNAIPLSKYNRTVTGFHVGTWYFLCSDMSKIEHVGESPRDSLSMVISWTWDDGTVEDGVVLPFVTDVSMKWTLLCANVRFPREPEISNIHVYIHRHDRNYGTLFVDDVFVHPTIQEGQGKFSKCQNVHRSKPAAKIIGLDRTDTSLSPKLHLVSTMRPSEKQLTLAVPCTCERILRLETLSYLYGGGPVAAAVLVKDLDEARTFAKIWRRKPWMRNYVDVLFVRSSLRRRTPIPINALRNVALSLARTEFVAMLDVDMTPATHEFECFRDDAGSYLTELLPRNGKTLLALPVFVISQNQRSAKSKKELMNLVGMQKGTTYCLNSQKPIRTWRWYTESESYDLRFMAGFEPYGIGRRDEYPQFDERFVGYGFNKISWMFSAERRGYKILTSTKAFVTHLNHVENDWVQRIDVPQYLNTWRRYFSFVADNS